MVAGDAVLGERARRASATTGATGPGTACRARGAGRGAPRGRPATSPTRSSPTSRRGGAAAATSPPRARMTRLTDVVTARRAALAAAVGTLFDVRVELQRAGRLDRPAAARAPGRRRRTRSGSRRRRADGEGERGGAHDRLAVRRRVARGAVVARRVPRALGRGRDRPLSPGWCCATARSRWSPTATPPPTRARAPGRRRRPRTEGVPIARRRCAASTRTAAPCTTRGRRHA